MSTRAIFLILMVATACTAIAADAGRTMTIDDVLALRSVSDPRLSPDGRWVAYTVEHMNHENDENVSAIYMAATDDGTVLRQTRDDTSAHSPQWSPDGRFLAFLAARGDDDAKTQVWTLDRRGGEALAWTDVDQGVVDYGWSPDGQRMWLLIKDQSAMEREELRASEAGEEPQPLPWVIDRLQFKQDGVTYLDRSRTHVYVSDARMAEPRQLTFGDYDDAQPAWSLDGSEIAFVSNRTAEPDSNYNTDIWIVAAGGGAPAREPRRVTDNPGADSSPAWRHDGRYLTYVTVIEPDLIWYATNHLAVIPARGGQARVLTSALDRNVSSPRYAPGGDKIHFRLEDSAAQHLAAYDVDSGTISRPVDGQLSVRDYDLNARGDIVAQISVPHRPDEVFLLQGGKPRQLSHTNDDILDAIELAGVRNVTFPSADGTEIEGFIVTPPDYNPRQRYPTLLRIHGGPVAQYDFSFNRDAQLFAANGYVVVMTNPRGSSGYGQDFSSVLWANWGNPDFEDVIAGVDFAIREGYADPEQLGVGGWSYGGILTNYVITKSQRFKGAITGASEVLYVSNYGHDHYQRVWEAELGLPWIRENREKWESITPFNDVDKVTTPTLIMGGKEDWNVPINNSEQLYQALKRLGVETQLVVYPDESHGISRPSFIRDRYRRYLDWYDRYVRGE